MQYPSRILADRPALLRTFAFGALLSCLAVFPLQAQQATTQETPDLDVPYVPTPQEVVDKMLDMAQVTEGDYVIDLGSGDGRIAISAAKRGAKAMGIDLNPVRVQEAQENAKKAGVTDSVEFKQQNLFDTDFSKADVLTMYLLSGVNIKLRPVILKELQPGTRVVSHAFDMDEWEPDQVAKVDGRTVYYWVVPAQVEGVWQVKNGDKAFTVNFDQDYQMLKGTAEMDGKSVEIKDAKLNGDQITFTLDDGSGNAQTFQGRVTGDKIEPAQTQVSGAGTVKDWEASRTS